MPSRKRPRAESLPAGFPRGFDHIRLSTAAIDEYQRQAEPVRRCLAKAFEDLKQGELRLDHALLPHRFVSFACGFAIWTTARPGSMTLFVLELSEYPEDLL
jgi:hypothetical protein